jgi:hypothetical protein
MAPMKRARPSDQFAGFAFGGLRREIDPLQFVQQIFVD